MNHSFNLVHQPFLPCQRHDRSFVELSILDVLSEAHRVRVIVDESPLVTAALHRLLLAVLHRCFGPDTPQIWANLWRGRSEGFPMDGIRAYLRQWEHRFDLFDPARPFYQTAALQTRLQRLSVSKLVPELASGNNATLFDHTCDRDACWLTPAAAARAIISAQSFSACGLVSFVRKEDRSADAAPLASGAVVLVRGETLTETLLLNLHQYDPDEGEPFPVTGKDITAWERDGETKAEDRLPVGYLDLLTWQSRRILLIPETGHNCSTVVSGVVIMKGNQFPDEWAYRRREPMVAFRASKKPSSVRDAWLPISFRPSRAVWRDSGAFLQFQVERDLSTRPRLFWWLNRLIYTGALPETSAFIVDVFGQATDKASVLLWRHESLPVPSAYLVESVLTARLHEALKFAEDSYFKLRISAQAVMKELGAGEAIPHLAALEGRFWAVLELEFLPFFRSLPVDRRVSEDGSVSFGDTTLSEWTDAVRWTALRCFQDFSFGLGATARVTVATARAENRLRATLSLGTRQGVAQPQEDRS
jgi:CRISPR system Cascade subunit CasA